MEFCLGVNVAKRCATKSVEEVLDRASRANGAHLDRVFDRGIPARWVVLESHGTGDLVRFLGMEDLVNPVESIEHGMMQEEGGIVGAGVKIGVIAVDGVVSGCVKAKELVGVSTLDLGPEAAVSLRGFADGNVKEILRPVPLAHGVAIEVPRNTAWVVICQSFDYGFQAIHRRVEGTDIGSSAEEGG